MTRAEFEEWIIEVLGPNHRAILSISELNMAWEGWQAATERAAKLCEEIYGPNDWCDGYNITSRCAAAIRGPRRR